MVVEEWFEDRGNHSVLFVFDNKLETNRVLASQLLSFDKHLVAIQRYEKSMRVRDLCFDLVPLWVQVHDIPIKFMNQEVAVGICSGIGKVCSSEKS